MADIVYTRRGSGPPLVLVHGLGSRRQCFDPIIDRLAEDHEVIAPDLPGFGQSPALDGVAPGPLGYADWLTDWLTEHGVERPHVVGSSMGGGVAVELGRAGVASAVTAFAPVGCYGPAGLIWVRGLLTALRLAGRLAGPALDRMIEHPVGRRVVLAALFGRPGRVDPAAARADLAGLVGASAFAAARDSFRGYRLRPTDDLGALPDIPVTIAWGTRDVVLTHRSQSTRARAALPFARHLDLPGCGHLPFSDDPRRCVQVIAEDDAARRRSGQDAR